MIMSDCVRFLNVGSSSVCWADDIPWGMGIEEGRRCAFYNSGKNSRLAVVGFTSVAHPMV